jgi:hypothetical protein
VRLFTFVVFLIDYALAVCCFQSAMFKKEREDWLYTAGYSAVVALILYYHFTGGWMG